MRKCVSITDGLRNHRAQPTLVRRPLGSGPPSPPSPWLKKTILSDIDSNMVLPFLMLLLKKVEFTKILDLTRGDTPSRQFGFVVAGANQTSARLWSREIRDGMLVRNVGIR